MSSSTTGANSIEKQEWFCRIKTISCNYESRGKSISGMLFQNNGDTKEEVKPIVVDTASSIGVLSGGITNDYNRYYVIANNEGINVEITCETNANTCDEESHKKVEICAPDLPHNPKDITEFVRNISDKELTIYYYNLFNHSKEWGETHPFFPVARVVGETVDLLAIFRYLLLPKLTTGNTQIIYDLQYHDCYGSPNILLDVYPDIDFGIEIGFMGFNRNLEHGIDSKDTISSQNFVFDFSIKYGSIEKKFNYESFLSLERQSNNNLLYRTLKFIGKFFYETGCFAESLGKEIESNGHDDTTRAIGNDLKGIGKTDKFIGKTLVRSRRWLSGSFSIQPKLQLQWRYETSEDLRELLRHIQLALGFDCAGTLTIDIVELALKRVRKVRTLTTVAAVGAAVVSGGLASILAALVKLLVDVVVTWLINKLKEGFKFNLILIGNVGVESLTYDSLRDVKVKGLTVAINPEIRLEIGVDVKTTITLFIIKASGAIGGGAEATTSLKWELELNSKDGDLGVDHTMEINPFKLKIGVYAVGGFEISKKKSKESKLYESTYNDTPTTKITHESSISYGSEKKSEWSHEWGFNKISCEIDRWIFFKPE